jgi:hypothetical protein
VWWEKEGMEGREHSEDEGESVLIARNRTIFRKAY